MWCQEQDIYVRVMKWWYRTMAYCQQRRAFMVFVGLGLTTVLVFLMHSFPAASPRVRSAPRRNSFKTFKTEVENGRENSTSIVEGEAPLSVKKTGRLVSYTRGVIAATFIPNISEEYYQPRKDKVNRLEAIFLITNRGFCNESSPYLLVVVPSIATHTSERTAIRNTYGAYKTPWRVPTSRCSDCANNSSREREVVEKRTKVLFFFGRGENSEIDQLLREESKRYGDIVQADFHESYANLTLKMMVILKWVTRYCGKVDYVLKTDEDVFINIPRLISQLHPLPYTLEGLVIGQVVYEAKVMRSGKWQVKTEEFPLSIYPTYASGNAYVISGNIIPRIFSVSEYMPYMPMEDVFVTGILAKIIGSKHIFIESFTYWYEQVQRPCDFVRQNRTIAPKLSTEEIGEFWLAQTAFDQKCLTPDEYYQPRKDKVNRLEATFLIANNGFCDVSAPYLLVVVPSIATHTSERTAIRNTYGSYKTPWRVPTSNCPGCANNNSREREVVEKRTKVLFFFGRGENSEIDQLLREESKRYGDIVQADFHESYANLTLKMMVILKWVTSFCGGVDYMLKVDEDVFVNVPKLISQLHSLPNTVGGLVIGYMNNEALVYISGKWGVRTDQFPLSTYPTYASGNAYVISGNIIPRMFSVSEYMPYMPMEDVFVTGILAKIIGSKHISMEGFTYWSEQVPIPCDFVRQNKTTATKVDTALMQELWEAQTKFEQKCLTSEEYYQLRKNKVNRLVATFLIANKGFCNESTPYLLVVVPSIATHTSERTAIRNTYGSYKTPWRVPTSHCSGCANNSSREGTMPEKSIKLLFFFGRGESAEIDQLLREESTRYGDIVQADFHESYANLTLKMMVILKWVTSFCGRVDYVLKIDEDVFVNIHKLISQLHPLPYTVGGLVIGAPIYDGQVMRSGKWQVRTEEFPLPIYPTYASGKSYVISGNIIPRMFSVSEYMPYMPIEDVFVTGILAKMIGSKHIFMDGFTNWFETAQIPCDFVRQNKTTASKVDAALMRKLWEAQTRFEHTCQ